MPTMTQDISFNYFKFRLVLLFSQTTKTLHSNKKIKKFSEPCLLPKRPHSELMQRKFLAEL